MVKGHFIDALAVSDMRLRIKQARSQNLNETVRHAIELEAILNAEQRLKPMHHSTRAMRQENSQDIKVTSELNGVHASVKDLQKSIELIIKELKEPTENDFQMLIRTNLLHDVP